MSWLAPDHLSHFTDDDDSPDVCVEEQRPVLDFESIIGFNFRPLPARTIYKKDQGDESAALLSSHSCDEWTRAE